MHKTIIFTVLSLGSCFAQAQPPTPLLWQISDANNSVYLLGSFHLLKAADYPLAAAVNNAFDAAESVYFEIPPEDIDNPESSATMQRMGTFSGDSNLQQSLTAETWQRLEQYCLARNLSLANFQKFEPWLLALMLSIAEMQKAGLQTELGLDRYFAKLAQAAGKPTGALETVAAQFALLDGMSAEDQEQFLAQSLEEFDTLSRDLPELHRLWRAGDVEGLHKLLGLSMKSKSPRIYHSFVTTRNNTWLPQIEALLNGTSRDDALVVVGALHLLGDDGLVALLQRQGYTVERVR